MVRLTVAEPWVSSINDRVPLINAADDLLKGKSLGY